MSETGWDVVYGGMCCLMGVAIGVAIGVWWF